MSLKKRFSSQETVPELWNNEIMADFVAGIDIQNDLNLTSVSKESYTLLDVLQLCEI